MFKTRFLLLILLVSSMGHVLAQPLEIWGVSPRGGIDDNGFIYKTDESGENLEIVYQFEGGTEGGGPFWSLTQTSNGRIFGVTSSGGANDVGVLYSISPDDYSYQVHYDFATDLPLGSLTQVANGKLYGFGSAGFGYIFEFDLETQDFKKVHEFDKTHGRIVFDDNQLLEVMDNVLYGTTERGGADDIGVIYRYDISTSTYEVLYEFDDSEGRYPESLAIHSEGILYGITSWQDQRIFHFNYETNEVTTVFELPDIHLPVPGILLASDGYYYGMTSSGGDENHGSFYRVDVENQEFTTLHHFKEFSGPHIPDMPVIEGSNGKIYGNTRYVSYANAGLTIFEYDPETEALEVKSAQSGGLSIYGLREIALNCATDEFYEARSCESFTFNGEVLTASGTYQGAFQNTFGCDSLVTIDLTIMAEEECVLGVSTPLRMTVYPNPAHEVITITGLNGQTAYEIFDLFGRRVQNGVTEETIQLTIEKGMYMLNIQTSEGTQVLRIVKE